MPDRYKGYRMMNIIIVFASLLNMAKAETVWAFCFSLSVAIYAYATKELLSRTEKAEDYIRELAWPKEEAQQ